MPSIPGLRPARRRREHPAISQRKRDAATPPLSFTDRTSPPEIEKGRDLRRAPSEFLFFSTLKFRISNRRGVYRQLFDIYFRDCALDTRLPIWYSLEHEFYFSFRFGAGCVWPFKCFRTA